MIVVHDINKKQGKKFWSHLDVFSLCYVLLKKVAPIAPRAPRAPISREYVRIGPTQSSERSESTPIQGRRRRFSFLRRSIIRRKHSKNVFLDSYYKTFTNY